MAKVEYLIWFDLSGKKKKGINTIISLIRNSKALSLRNINSPIVSSFEIGIKSKNMRYPFQVINYTINQNGIDFYKVYIIYQTVNDEVVKLQNLFENAIKKETTAKIITIWNDISFDRTKELYHLIYTLENNLRLLFTQFMIVNVGTAWHKDIISLQLKSRNRNENKDSNQILYGTDFKELKDFLFKEYSIPYIDKKKEFLSKLDQTKILNQNMKNQIKEFMQMCNWDRYFHKFIKADSKKLKADLDFLYEIRCKVAHNNFIGLEDFSKAKIKCDKLNRIVVEAISTINQIKLAKDELESLITYPYGGSTAYMTIICPECGNTKQCTTTSTSDNFPFLFECSCGYINSINEVMPQPRWSQ